MPLYLKHVMRVNEAYSRAGTREAAARKLAILTCQRAAGRSAEPAWMSFDGCLWHHVETVRAHREGFMSGRPAANLSSGIASATNPVVLVQPWLMTVVGWHLSTI